jgi:hypothetical protein
MARSTNTAWSHNVDEVPARTTVSLVPARTSMLASEYSVYRSSKLVMTVLASIANGKLPDKSLSQ